MNPGIDVLAAFNPVGEVKPVYIRLEDEDHSLQTYKIKEIRSKQTEKYSGLNVLLFICSIEYNNYPREIKLRFYCDSRKWVLMNS